MRRWQRILLWLLKRSGVPVIVAPSPDDRSDELDAAEDRLRAVRADVELIQLRRGEP